MENLVVYHVALDCSIDDFNKSPENIIFGTYGDMGNYIGTNVPVVFTLEDAHQTGIKLVNHVLKYGPLCKKMDNFNNIYTFPVRGYIIIKYIYNGSAYDFLYQNELKDNYITLANVIDTNNLVTFNVNGIRRGVINRNYFNNNMTNPQIFIVDEPRVSGIYNYMVQHGPTQIGLLQAYPTLDIPLNYHHTNHHTSHSKKSIKSDSSSYSPTKNSHKHRYDKYKMNGGEYDEFDDMYEEKYLKYKEKYLNLKND